MTDQDTLAHQPIEHTQPARHADFGERPDPPRMRRSRPEAGWHQHTAATRAVVPADGSQALRVSPGGVVFVLNKLADTVIPVRIGIGMSSADCSRESRISRVDRHGQGWRLRLPDCELPIERIGAGRIIRRPTVRGVVTGLAVVDRRHVQVALLRGQHEQCPAWRALIEWLLLRETGHRSGLYS